MGEETTYASVTEKVYWRLWRWSRRQQSTGILLLRIPIQTSPLQRRRESLEGRRAKEGEHGYSERDEADQRSKLSHGDHDGLVVLGLILTL